MQFSSLAPALVCAALLAGCAADDASRAGQQQRGPATAAPAGEPSQDGVDAGAADYVATGNEPFWSVRASGGTLVYSTPDDLDGQVLQATREESGGVLRFSGEADGAPFVLELHQEPCQDSMSGWMHDFRSRFAWGGRVLAGCARRGSDPVGELPPES
ncbi:hypothetical protein LY625_11635 [Lysobacter sp. GX 14042]|uniref:COG3650 family protein n=1 Tax=Lysobacter sp. GX 14042 TaxID=2907155 RepID=UPI001F2905A6|nr:hypothetical protein [Lysobacter sp. GX 14042]MCE7033259.1 hypothetical protein [Lysobacter sp. GX 14042]